MRATAQLNGQATYTEQNAKIQGFHVTFKSTTIADVTVSNMLKANVTITLMRDGDNVPVMSGPVFPLGVANNPSSYEGLAIGDYKSFYLSFGGKIIDLQDSDRLNVVLNVGFSVTGLETTICTDYADPGMVESSTPVVTVFTASKTRPSEPVTFGDNVTCIAVINTEAAHVATAANVQGTGWSAQFSITELYALMAEQWERIPEYYSYLLYNGSEIDRVNGSFDVNVAASGSLFFVAFSGRNTQKVGERAVRDIENIAIKQQNKLFGGKRFIRQTT